MRFSDDLFGEESFLERLQLVVLGLVFMAGFWGSRTREDAKSFGLLICALATIAFVRELDAVLYRVLFDGG